MRPVLQNATLQKAMVDVFTTCKDLISFSWPLGRTRFKNDQERYSRLIQAVRADLIAA